MKVSPDKKRRGLSPDKRLAAGNDDTLTVRVDEKALELLIHDLSKIEKEVKTTQEPAITERRELLRDYVEPPYLQIVCQRLWNEQVKVNSPATKGEFTFLEDYQTGSAMVMLKSFCHEKLERLTTREKDAAAAAFDFLVTSHGSKRAYDLDSLARHMRKDKTRLMRILEKLSDETVRILKITRRPDKSTWFELYHDMFSSIVYTWKEAYQRIRRKNIFIKNISIAAIVTVLVISSGYYTYQHFYENWYVIEPLQKEFVALKEGKTSVEEFRQKLTKARDDAPGSSRVAAIENRYNDWRLTSLEEFFRETKDLAHADTLLQALRDEFPDKHNLLGELGDNLLDRKISNVHETYENMVRNGNSPEDLKLVKEFLDSEEAVLGSDARILALQADLAKRSGDHETEQQFIKEKDRKQELARTRLTDAIQLKNPAGKTVKGGLQGGSAEFEIVLEESSILESSKVLIDGRTMSPKYLGKQKFLADTVTIPPEVNEISVEIKAVDREGNEGVKTFTFMVDRQLPELTFSQFLYRDYSSENWQAMPEGRWEGKFWRIEGEASEDLSSASIDISFGNRMNPLSFQTKIDKNHRQWAVEGDDTWVQNADQVISTVELEDQAGWKNPISLEKRVKQKMSTQKSLTAKQGKLKLFLEVSKSKERHGVFESSDGDLITYELERFVDHDVMHEMITFTKGEDEKPYLFYHMKYKTEGDRKTSEEDVYKFLELARNFGALKGHEDLLENERFLNRFKETDRTVEVFFTGAGLGKVSVARDDVLEKVYAEVYRDVDRPPEGTDGWERYAAPWLAVDHPDYGKVMTMLKTGMSNEPGGRGRGRTNNVSTLYGKLTGGRSFVQDRAAYENCERFVMMSSWMKSSATSRELVEHMGHLQGTFGLDFEKLVSAMARIAGPDDILVNELSLKSRRGGEDFVLWFEGQIQDIDAEIRRALDSPR